VEIGGSPRGRTRRQLTASSGAKSFDPARRRGRNLMTKIYTEHDRNLPPYDKHFQTPGLLPVTPPLISVAGDRTGIPNTTPAVGWGWLTRFYYNSAGRSGKRRGTHALHRVESLRHLARSDRQSVAAGTRSRATRTSRAPSARSASGWTALADIAMALAVGQLADRWQRSLQAAGDLGIPRHREHIGYPLTTIWFANTCPSDTR
jgi:hypothetical protein